MKIEVRDLRFSYPGGVEALCGVCLTVEAGELVAIVGQNGSGKTTLVKHWNGLLKPTAGEVIVGGWNTADHSVAQLAARVGYIFQNPDEQLFCATVCGEVAFGPQNLGFDEVEVDQQVKSALAMTGLGGLEQTNPYDLSTSRRKMVAVASVLAMNTPVIVFDEPTTGQDHVTIERIREIVQRLHGEGKTVIAITHDIDFCVENFERVIVMGNGRVLLDGEAGEVLTQEAVLASTAVDPPQLIRLGLRLGFNQPVRNVDEFIAAYQRWKSRR